MQLQYASFWDKKKEKCMYVGECIYFLAHAQRKSGRIYMKLIIVATWRGKGEPR